LTNHSHNGNNSEGREPGRTETGSGFGAAYDDGFGTGGTEGLLLPPWERRERFGFLNGFYLTVKDVLLAPRQFFHRMPSQVGLLQPLYFAVVLGVVASFFAWMWSLAGSSLQALMAEDLGEIFQGPFVAFGVFVLSPVTIAMGIFIKAALLHLVLMLVGGNRLGFEATFRVAAYGEAAGILALVPACGSIIGVVWTVVVTVIGLHSIHETDPWRAIVAVILPTAFCTSLVAASVIAFILSQG